ncbi:MAG TPA: WhiB family transcriptional regulator [Candidatus Limnocylindrales bacterium]
MIALARDADRGWMADAACRHHDPDLWFPPPGRSNTRAEDICAGCPVKERCADYADAHHEQHGVWGGMTIEQRNRRARKKAGGL